MSWFTAWVGSLWSRPVSPPPPEPIPPLAQVDRDARLRALKLHNDRLLADLAEELDPDARQLIRSLLDDRRFLESGRDD